MIRSRNYIVAVAKREDNVEYNPQKYSFKVIPNGKMFWVGDPFPIEVNNELYIFGEIYDYSKLKGCIAYTKLTEEGFTPWKKIIEESYHLSFPNIFEIDNEIYICPESHANKSLQIYKCISFPEKWKLIKTIMDDEDCVDTVFLERDKDFLGFTCEWHSLQNHFFKLFKINKGTEEYEFSKGEFRLLESYMSRPAGKLINNGDKLIMVSQICKPKYGSGLVFKEIKVDYPNYIEEELFRVYPNQIKCNLKKRFDGIHTFNMTKNYIVIDMIWTRFNAIEKWYRLLRKIKKHFVMK